MDGYLHDPPAHPPVLTHGARDVREPQPRPRDHPLQGAAPQPQQEGVAAELRKVGVDKGARGVLQARGGGLGFRAGQQHTAWRSRRRHARTHALGILRGRLRRQTCGPCAAPTEIHCTALPHCISGIYLYLHRRASIHLCAGR